MAGAGEAPVGVFDSGVGGLTILSELRRELPDERFIYFGDTGNCPYGVRAVTEIQELSRNAARFLLAHDAKMIVVACNTASVSALAELRASFPQIRFVGVVPAVKPAAERTRTSVVGIAATEASARGDYLQRLIGDHAHGVEVHAVGCPRLVLLAEQGRLDDDEVENAIRGYIQPLLDAGIDELVLGCTHFPAMRAVFERVAGPDVEVIDSGAAIARQTRRVLAELNLLAPARDAATNDVPPRRSLDEFWCSGDAKLFTSVATAILGMPVPGQHAPNMVLPPVNAW
ncbi:MAG TPA: glutamate racemase [Ktedonobacterales bacterium]|nr:glutamate racemase [Ktedonobacterales bacterium]